VAVAEALISAMNWDTFTSLPLTIEGSEVTIIGNDSIELAASSVNVGNNLVVDGGISELVNIETSNITCTDGLIVINNTDTEGSGRFL